MAPLIQNECLKRGLILTPLIITAEQIDEVTRRFAKALAAAFKRV